MRGKFIVLEGIDGSGTTTAAERLCDAGWRSEIEPDRFCGWLKTAEPSAGEIGKMIRRHLSSLQVDPNVLALLFAADRIDHVKTEINPHLSKGNWVICDRYVMSSWAYQGWQCNAPETWIRAINSQIPWPDLTMIFVVDPEEAVRRVQARSSVTRSAEEIFDRLEIQKHVAARYNAILNDGLPDVVAIDANRSADEVFDQVLTTCRERLGRP